METAREKDDRERKIVADSFICGAYLNYDPGTLNEFLRILATHHHSSTTSGTHTVQGIAISHAILSAHITKLDAANGRLQKWVIAMAAASLLAAGVQVFCAVRAELRLVDGLKPSVSAQGYPRLPDDTEKEAAPSDMKGDGAIPKPEPEPPPQ
jgi:hypothetical protein